jgi:hypothetical protein
MLKFEIIDFNTNKCKTIVKSDKTKTDAKTNSTSNNNSEVITADDRKYRDKTTIEQAEKVKALIDKNADIKEIEKELDSITSRALRYNLLLYAESKNYKVDNNLKSLLKDYETDKIQSYPISFEKDVYAVNKFIETAGALCSRFNDPCVNTKKVIKASEKDILNYTNGNNTAVTKTPSPQPAVPVTPPTAPIIKSDDEVLKVQSLLAKRGFYNGKIDGQLIAETRNAIIRAQNFYTISPADGSPTSKLIEALEKDTFISEGN